MVTKENVWKRYGSVKEIESESDSSTQQAGSSTLVERKLIWIPSGSLSVQIDRYSKAIEMPHSLDIECKSDSNSTSLRFVPVDIDVLVTLAKLWGPEMLIQEKDWSGEQSCRLDLSWFLYLRAPRTHAFLERNFEYKKDLKIPKRTRPADQPQHILPASKDGQILDINELLELGERTAHERDNQKPDYKTKIQLGLYACAKNDPLELEPSETRTLIRKALFDQERAPDNVDPELLEEVRRRSDLAFPKHLTEPLDETYNWLLGKNNTFLTQIIKKTKAHGPALERQAAQAALIELAWQGTLMLGECIEVLMKSFVANLPHGYEMSKTDDAAYELLYSRHPRLGSLPLIFLRPRFFFVREAMIDLMIDPTDIRRFGVLNRLLSYYADMTNQRRQIDRETKQRKKTATSSKLDKMPDTSSSNLDEFQAVAAEFRVEREATCECGTTTSWRAENLQDPESLRDVLWEDSCTVCKHRESVEIDRNRFKKKWKKLEEKEEKTSE